MSESPKVGSSAGNRGKGRKKGVPNKLTGAAKDAIAFAANGLGGGPRIVEWAKEDPKNEAAFWTTIYPKLIPVQVSGEGGGPVEHGITVRFV